MSASANSIWKQLAMNSYTYNNRACKSLQIIHFCPFLLRPSCFWFCGAVPPFLLNRASFSVDELAFYSFFSIPFFHVAKTLFPIKACDPTTTKASHGDTGGNLVTEWKTVGGYIITTKRSVKAHPQETTSANSLVFSRNGVSLNAARQPTMGFDYPFISMMNLLIWFFPVNSLLPYTAAT